MILDYNKDKWGELSLKYLVIDSEEYIVFIDTENHIDWITSDDYDKTKRDEKKHLDILHKIAVLECKPNEGLSEKVIIDFKRLLGEALSCSFCHSYETAENIILDAEKYIQNRGEELSRLWYLSTAGNFTLIVVIFGIIAWILKDCFIYFLGKTFFECSLSMVVGSLGALLSIIMRMGEEKLDIHAGKLIHKLEAKYRIIAGMLSALLVVFAISSEIIFPMFLKVENPNIFLLLISFIAGMSERLAPSISSKLIEKNESE